MDDSQIPEDKKELETFAQKHLDASWLQIPFGHGDDEQGNGGVAERLSVRYQVDPQPALLPCVVVVDGEGNMINSSVRIRTSILENPEEAAKQFPWPKPELENLLK